MKITNFVTATLLVSSISSTALRADDGKSYKTYLAIGITMAQGHAHDMTQTTWSGLGSYVAEAGIQFNLPGTNVQVRPNFGVARINSKSPEEGTGINFRRYNSVVLGGSIANAVDTGEDDFRVFDLMDIYVGFDVVFSPFKSLPLSLSTGPSIHSWNIDDVKAPVDQTPMGYTDPKVGWRLGASYAVTDSFSVTLDYTLAEWRILTKGDTSDKKLDQNKVMIPGFNPSRPCYFTLKASYRF